MSKFERKDLQELKSLDEDIYGKDLVIEMAEHIQECYDEIDRLEKECETERMRLAACGVAALGYYDGCHDDYKSASLSDVLRLEERARASAWTVVTEDPKTLPQEGRRVIVMGLNWGYEAVVELENGRWFSPEGDCCNIVQNGDRWAYIPEAK